MITPPALPPPAPASPLPPKRRLFGRRINRIPAIIFSVMLVGIGGVVLKILYDRHQWEEERRAITVAQPTPSNPSDILKNAPSGYIDEAAYRLGPAPSAIQPPQDKKEVAVKKEEPDAAIGLEAARKAAWGRYWKEYEEVRTQRFDKRKTALFADSAVALPHHGGSEAQAASAEAAPSATPVSASSGMAGGGGWGGAGIPGLWGGGGFGWGGNSTPQIDRQGQQDKIAFAGQQGDLGKNDYVPTVRKPADPFAVIAGSFVKFSTITESNSDVPGSQIGMVSENVWNNDGSCILIPQGSKLIGHYSTMVSTGQDRLPIVLTRINFPDGSHQAIGAMEGADNAGSAGERDQVNYHLVQKFGAVFLASLPAAALQLSQPHGNTINGYDSQQILAGTLGLQMAQLAQEIARQQLSIPNTITIRAGYNGTMVTDKDLHISPAWSCPGDTRRAMSLPIMAVN